MLNSDAKKTNIRTSNLSRAASAIEEARAGDASNDELSGSLALAVDVRDGGAAGARSTFDEAAQLFEDCVSLAMKGHE